MVDEVDRANEQLEKSIEKGIDFLANGFKIRGNEAHTNGSGIKFIYYAVAEQPLVSSNGVPALAK